MEIAVLRLLMVLEWLSKLPFGTNVILNSVDEEIYNTKVNYGSHKKVKVRVLKWKSEVCVCVCKEF